MGYTLTDYQREICDKLLQKKKAVLCLDCGMGKTAISLVAGRATSLPMSIICPPSLIPKWKSEIKKWDAGEVSVYSSRNTDIPKKKYKVIILDESHLYHNANWRHIHCLFNYTDYLFFLTATPSNGDPMSLYLPLKTFGMLPFGYYRQQFMMDYYGGVQTYGHRRFIFPTKPTNVDKLKHLFDQIAIYGRRNLDIKRKIHTLGEGFEYDMSDLESFSSNSKEFGIRKINDPRVEGKVKELSEKYKKVLFYFFHTEVGEMLQGMINGSIKIDGSTPVKKRFEILASYEKLKIGHLIAQQSSLGQGFDVESVDAVVFVESCWSPAKDRQCFMRAYRMERKKSLNVYWLFYKNEHRLFIRDKKTAFIKRFNKGENLTEGERNAYKKQKKSKKNKSK